MNIFALTRKLPDGKTAVGPLFYIILALGILGLFVYYNFRMSGNPKAVEAPKNPKTDVAEVANAAAAYQGVTEEKEAPKGKLPVGSDPATTAGNGSFLDSFDYVNTLDSKATAEKNRNSTGTLDLATPTPAPRLQPATASATPLPPQQYNPAIFYNPTPSPTPFANSTPVPAPVSGFETNNFLPRGALIPVYFLSTVKTGALEDLVVLAVAENVVFNHKVQLPFGTRLLGSAAAGGDGDRVAINVDTVLFPNGEELPISGLGKDIDRGPGIRAYYIPQPVWVTLLPYVNNFIAAYLNTLQKTIPTTTTVVTTAGTTVSQEQPTADMSDTQTALVSSASNALMNATQVTMDQINKLYKPYLVIPPGTPAFVQLRQATDITRKRVNGSASNPMGILPGFQNNPIPPAGLQPDPAPTPFVPSSVLSGSNSNVSFVPVTPTVLPGNGSSLNDVPDLTNRGVREPITTTNQAGLIAPLSPTNPAASPNFIDLE